MSRFKPGQSGNPNGRPKNAKSSVTALRKDLITDEDLQAIVDVVIGKAKGGDLTAAGMILDRRLPRLRVTADFGLEKDSLAEQLKAARERVAAASRPLIQVVTGFEGGLQGGDDAAAPDESASLAPKCAHAREAPALASYPAAQTEAPESPPPRFDALALSSSYSELADAYPESRSRLDGASPTQTPEWDPYA
jgi:hypothetical protein